MGNNQSNTSKNYRTYKIGVKFDFSNFTPEQMSEFKEKFKKFKYGDEKKWEKEWDFFEWEMRKEIDFSVINSSGDIKCITCPNCSPFDDYQVGDYVKISERWNSWEKKNVYDSDDMKLVGKVDWESKVRDLDGKLLEATGDFLKEYNEANQRHIYMAENQVLQSQTSWNMPPKW